MWLAGGAARPTRDSPLARCCVVTDIRPCLVRFGFLPWTPALLAFVDPLPLHHSRRHWTHRKPQGRSTAVVVSAFGGRRG